MISLSIFEIHIAHSHRLRKIYFNISETVHVGTVAQTLQRTPDGQLIKKNVRLTPQQMHALKLVTPGNTQVQQKIHSQNPQSNFFKTAIITSTPKNFQVSPPILDHSGSRKRQDSNSLEIDYTPDS